MSIQAYSYVRKGPYISGLHTPPYSSFPENVRKNVRTESAYAYRLLAQGCVNIRGSHAPLTLEVNHG